MNRRTFLRAGGLGGASALAGCTGLFETRSARVPPLLDERPNAVYVPTHTEGMGMLGTAETDGLKFMLNYSYPHRFWNANGSNVEFSEVSGDVHLMATVWDTETDIVLPETGLSVDVLKEGESVGEEVIYPMLSQPMGFHYGSNFTLDGDGQYTGRVQVGGMSTRRTGAFADRFAEPASVDIDFSYEREKRDRLPFQNREDAGERGAVEPMDMPVRPASFAPARDDLPGEMRGEVTTGDAVLVVTVLDSPPEGVEGDGQYLAVSARTPYNRMILPAMGLEGTLARGGEAAFEGTLRRTLDPNLNYHYGAVVPSVESGDELTLSVTTMPQVARHEGYETAFRQMPDRTLTL
ncbi:twin-arginine translocation signal domain-containing protein [Halomarina litorea]|uniref:twin-arginine translocation signal domain-containing protein n=1 Tax=Halomarina litorea TaxID=2961595 RepID=UPI0020C4B7BB|nr:twin-arginine translocation signal domain-containing protein [Halomarina sp. BCD28]